MKDCGSKKLLAVALLMALGFATIADAQQHVPRAQCTGNVTGIPSKALIEVTPGGRYTEGPGVAGRISNQFADYTFNGILFGGTEGFVSLVELRTGARIDRVWIGVSAAGFALRTEDGAIYTFQCK
jgi:hypothetical protein